MNGLVLRTRLLRRMMFRLWKSLVLSGTRSLVSNVRYDSPEILTSPSPVIFLTTFSRPAEFVVLSSLFSDKDLTFIAPRNLPNNKYLDVTRSINHVIFLDEHLGFRFFRQLLATLRNFNRSLVISPFAAARYAPTLPMDPGVIVRISMLANVPLVPVVFRWSGKQCEVSVGKKVFISPRSSEFKDIFFKTRGARKFRNLSQEDLAEIGSRIFSKISWRGLNGPNLS